VVQLALDLRDSPSLDLLVEDDSPLPASLLQSFFSLLLRDFLQRSLFLLEDSPLGLYLHLFELPLDPVMKIIEGS
jgi:hypothetical protein